MINLKFPSNNEMNEKVRIIQDTRNKAGKPIRTAFEKAAVENGAVVHAQALDFGDYCAMTNEIQNVLDRAAESRIIDVTSDAAVIDFNDRIKFLVPDLTTRQQIGYHYKQCISDRTNLIRGILNAVPKSSLSGLYPRAVETKWHLAELDGCIDNFLFEEELRKAKRNNCAMLVLVVTDRNDDFYTSRIGEYKARLGSMGAYLDFCTLDEVFYKVCEFLFVPTLNYYHFALNDHIKNGFRY